MADRTPKEPGEEATDMATDDKDLYVLKLYVTGMTPRSRKAIENLRGICEEDLHGRYRMEVVDVLERPRLAEDERILATPLLIKKLPPPLRRIIGDLSDREQVLLGLDVRPGDEHGAEGGHGLHGGAKSDGPEGGGRTGHAE